VGQAPGPDNGYRQGPSRINCNEVGSIDPGFYDGGIAVARNADWNIYTEQEANHMIHNGEIFFGE